MRKTDLLAYKPDYYEKVYEMDELLKAQGSSLASFEDLYHQQLLNQFISQADSTGISIFESQYQIIPQKGETLEERRNEVLTHILPPKPITLIYFNQLLRTMNIKATAIVEYGKRKVNIVADRDDITDTQLITVRKLLNIYLPANMLYEIKVKLATSSINERLNVGLSSVVRVNGMALANEDQFNN
ncbi:putative phage tail protein [Lactobacillus sp. PV034]|uniref:putative phage tail protein n=1 Tax=Lactobacillus sp. PV034 TaxID=2594495 RepID=UPI00224023DB|nr:putative phage tail protein [Lactobacillus sp. PV034]QNQ80775.1 DUF2313 domain-containing protein [Lactobacillus sp. PV034]